MTRPTLALIASIIALAAGCSIPSSSFAPTADAPPSDGAGSDTLAIVPSVTALTVAEKASKELTVTLSRAPAQPLTVQVDSASSAIVLTTPDMTFDASNFDQPRTIVVTGIADRNVADAQAEIALTATGLSPVTVAATVDDLDTVALVTNVAGDNIITVNGGQSVDVTVRLSHEPEGDVTVSALLGTGGPCTVDSASRVFTPQNYDTDQTFRFTAATDANTSSDTQSLKLRIGAADREYTLQEIDADVLNFAVSPSALTVTEQSTPGNLNVALTQQPAANVVVAVSVVSQTGVVTVDKNQLTFTPANYATNQTLKVTGADDADIDDDTAQVVLMAGGITTREITVTINDNDDQEIETNVLGTQSVDEEDEIMFGVRLKQQPSADMNVAVSSLATAVATVTQGSVLTFTPANYNTYQTVKVRGTHDTNLAANTTQIRASLQLLNLQKDVTVEVTDIDEQELLVTQTSLSVPEGMQRSFAVSLRYQPLAAVTVDLAGTDTVALPLSATELDFTTTNYGTPQTVMVSAPVDNDDVAETSEITISGAGAPVSRTVTATVSDGTDVDIWGWSSPFLGALPVQAGRVLAYRVPVGAVAQLEAFFTYLPTAAGTFRMALYTDNGNGAPGSLVTGAEMLLAKPTVTGVNEGPITADPQLDAPMYWIAIRFSQNTTVGYAGTTQTGQKCTRNINIADINAPWPASFGAATCITDNLINVWISTYHQ